MTVVEVLSAERQRLTRIAYRMLGSWTDAEDVVGDVAVESVRGDHDPENPAGWLTTITVRRSLDLLRRRKRERQHYIGPWLPEPLVADDDATPDAAADQRAELSIGFLRLAESLTPTQRAVIILRSFGYSHDEISTLLEITSAASRQHEHRARRRLGTAPEQPTAADDDDQQRSIRRLLDSFVAAANNGDTGDLIKLLHDDVVYYSDGGGKVKAARNPIVGATKIVRFLTGISQRGRLSDAHLIQVNSSTGMMIEMGGNRHVIAVDIEDGLITTIYDVSNPDKLPPVVSQPVPAESARSEY